MKTKLQWARATVLLLALLAFVSGAKAQTAVGDSWNDDFEGSTCGWQLINGTLTNAWAWGTATNNGGTHALYISNDNGTTNAYSTNSDAMVYAAKLFSFTQGKYEFSYEWNAKGESTYDYLRVALVPATVELSASTSAPSGFSTTSLPTGWIALDGGSKLNQVSAWQNKSVTIDNVPAGNYYMVFAWRNDYSTGTNPPAAIDNVSITLEKYPKPTGLTCTLTPGNSTIATLSWTENGTATAWQICLNGDEDHLINANSNTYNLTGLTPETNYTAKVRSVIGNETSSWSAPITFMPTNRVTIGSGSSTQGYGLPTNTGMKYTFSQQLYTPDQLGSTPCTFTGMDFMGTNFYTSDKPSVLRKLDIYMVQTDQTIFNGSSWTDWVPITYDNLVFSGNVTFLENEWTVINFDTPFIYDGTKNVCVVVYDHTGTAGYNGHYVTFKTNGTISSYGTYQSMYADGDNAYDVTDLSFQGSSCSRSNNYIRLLKDSYPTCERPTAVNVGTITPYAATITWEGSGSTWNLQYKKATDTEWTTVSGITTKSYALSGLTPETTYHVGVQTNCGGGDLSLWKRNTFTTTEVTPTPSGLECTGYTATTATLSWTENGEATTWQVCLNNDETNLIEANSNPFTMTGLTEDVIYSIKVRATNGGLTSHWTDAVSVQPTDKLCLGLEGTTSHTDLPYDSYANYSLSQQIYTAVELGATPCSFTKVDFLMNGSTALKRTLDIYMVQTDKTTFDSNSDWVTFSADDRVFSGEVQSVKNAWTSITFDSPFMYDGQHNVVLIVLNKTNNANSAISWATYSTGDNYQALYGDNSYGIDLTTFADLFSNRVKQKNQIRLMPGAYNTCLKPTSITVSNVTTTSATISWTSEATLFDLLVDGQLIEGITTKTYEMTNLAMASVHEVQVRTNCGGGSVSPWSNAVSFNTILCNDEDKCVISYELSNNYSYSSTWYGNAIQVTDVLTGELLDNWTILEGSTFSGSLAVCNGRQIQFSWKKASGSERCVYSVYDNNGDLIFSGTGPLTTPVTHTVDCSTYLTKPTDLACTATTATTATLSWTEKGTATQWQICLDDNEDNLIAANSNPFTIDGFTNNTFHTAKVRAVGDNIVSKWSDAITFEVTSKVRIGTGTTTSNILPVNIYYKYGLSEQIYTAAELGSVVKTIESIDFYKTATYGTPTCNLDIYMVLTTKERFTGYKDWVSVTAGDLVFSGNVTFAADAWTTITLDTPFEYDGESNVLLVIDNNTGSYGTANSFYTFNEDYYDRSLCYSSSDNIDPTGDLSDYSGNKQYVRNQIRIEFGDAPAVPKPAGFKTTTVYNHSAWLRWNEKGSATQWQLSVSGGSFGEETIIDITKNPYLLEGLSAETDYTVKVRATNGTETSSWAGPISFTTEENDAPYGLDAGQIGPNSTVLSWYDEDDVTAWVVAYKADAGGDFTEVNVTETTYTLTGLTPETQYTVRVRAVIPDETCPWSDDLVFTTTEINPVPRDIAVSSAHSTATVKWLGFSDSYNVQYREAPSITNPIYSEGFEGDDLDGTLVDCVENTTVGEDALVAHSGNRGFVFNYSDNPPQYLISPQLANVAEGMKLQFWYRNYAFGYNYVETFHVGFSSTTNETSAFTFGSEIKASDEQWHLYSCDVPAATKYICLKHTSDAQYFLFIDDIVVGTETGAGQWQTVNTDEASATITGLDADTMYELQVRGVTDEAASAWSPSTSFTTLPATTKIFFADGNWNDADNWEPAGAPTSTDDVVIQAAAVIPSGVVAMARNITIEGMDNGGGEFMAPAMTPRRTPIASTPSITIKDGGQLRHATDGLPVIVEKDISGYGDSPAGGFHLLATPMHDYPTDVDGMTEGNYDLYEFTEAPTDDLEWRNFKAQSFWLYNNNESGYLYANSTDRVLSFSGESGMTDSGTTWYSIVSVIDDVAPFTSGWRIFGNTATANAYVDFGDIYNDNDDNFVPATCNFYKINAAGNGFNLYKNRVVVAPGEAVFMEVRQSGRLRCSYEPFANAPTAEEGTYNMPWLPQHGLTAHQDAHVVLADASDNTNLITALNGKTVSVVLNGRTLYRDGYWNTLTLPFNLTLADSPLAGATARPLSKGSITGTTLNLTFGDAVAELVAGTPYIIMWAEANTNIVNPVFSGVTVSSATNNYDSGAGDGDLRVRFLGTYKSTEFTTTDQSILFIGAENMLYYPEPSGGQNPVIGACRAFFKIGNDSQGARQLTAFNIDFGDETNGIENVHRSTFNVQSESWFTVDGRKLNGKPARAGVYINNGRKVVIK